jgi:hypothetical protein
MRSKNHIPKSLSVPQDSNNDSVQRQIDFKKYLHDQEVLKAKVERRQARAMIREAELTSIPDRKECYLFDEEEAEDYIDEEIEDNTFSR